MTSTDSSASLISHLLSIHNDKYAAATQHPFLAKAGNGTIAEAAVCKWLVQDKYYQLAYVNFIGRLLAKLGLLSALFPSDSDKFDKERERLSRLTMDLLIDSLTNIRREIDFYDETAKKYHLDLEQASPNKTTREYINLFEDASAKDEPLLHGLLVLWATEHSYLQAWTHASDIAAESQPRAESDAGVIAALHKEFIPNWTSEAFRGFVGKLGEVVDAWFAVDGEEEWKEERGVCEGFWESVLMLEARFWPEV